MKRLILISASSIFSIAAFAQSGKCVNAPVSITGSPITLTSSGAKSVTENKTYVYCERRHHKRTDPATMRNENSPRDEYSSDPLLLNSDKTVKAMPESYNVSLSTPQSNVTVCPDSALKVNADINMEKVSSYTGNYPDRRDNNMYKQVSRREYKVAERKMHKIERKEEKIARISHTDVDVKSDND